MPTKSDADRIAELEREVVELKAANVELAATQETKRQRKPIAWRSVFSAGVLSLALVLMVPAGLILWLDRTVIQPDRYIAAIGPVISEPAVQKAIQVNATDAIFAQVDVNQVVSDALPERAQFLAGPIASQVKTYTSNTIGTIVASPQFANAWVAVNQRAQAAFMNVARNSDGNPNVDINQLYGFISKQLESTPLAAVANKQLPANIGNIQVATVPALQKIPHYVTLLETWRWLLIAIVVLLLAAGIALAKQRRRAWVKVGLGIVLVTILTLVAVRVTRAIMLDSITNTVNREAAVAIWKTVLNTFFVQTAVTAVLGLAIALTGWLAGPSRSAVQARTLSQSWLARGRVAVMPSAEQSGIIRVTRRYHHQILWSLLGLTILVLLTLTPLTVSLLITVLVVSALLLLIVEFLVAPVTEPETTIEAPSAETAKSAS